MNCDKQRQRAVQEKPVNGKWSSSKLENKQKASKQTTATKKQHFDQQSCPNNENQPLYRYQKIGGKKKIRA